MGTHRSDIVPTHKEQGFYHTSAWRNARAVALKEGKYHCWYCWKHTSTAINQNLQVDHIIPIEQGGAKYNVANLQVLCATCHQHKTKSNGFKAHLLKQNKFGGKLEEDV